MPRILLVFRYVLLALVIGFALYYFARQWNVIQPALAAMNPWWVLCSFLALLVGMAANVLSWATILNGLGHVVPFARGAQIMLVGQLGKYVPGSVWAYVMQMELGRQYGIARARVLVTSLYAAGIGVVASLLWGALALPSVAASHPELLWLFALLPIGLICLHPRIMTWLADLALKVFRRPPLEHEVRFTTIAKAVGWALLSYALYGVHLWLLSTGDLTAWDLVVLAAALSLGFTLGLFAFILPSGVGVREAVLIGMMSLVMPLGEASAISLVSRGMFTAGDLLTAGAAALIAFFMRRSLHPSDVRTAEYVDVASQTIEIISPDTSSTPRSR